MKRTLFYFSIVLASIMQCCKSDESPIPVLTKFNFSDNTEGWVNGFADYPNDPNVDTLYEFDFGYAHLPTPLNTLDGALMLSGNNHSDDLFMFVTKKITGLAPNRDYEVQIEMEIATNAANSSIGVGGAPGESVYIKAGAYASEPAKVLDNSDNHYRMNLDKGNQGQEGKDMKLIGNFANGTTKNEYILKTLRMSNSLRVASNPNGELWVIVGTDSGFESTTTIYFNSITVQMK
ncbi:MAG: hypothetical protein HOP30_18230 [Cyclobacteriaceae bacterium]|nr:hypothetical protein [Cyclobacteriaceae bacterium]